MFIVSQILLRKSNACQEENVSTYSIGLGLAIYAAIYVYVLFYKPEVIEMFHGYIFYIVAIDLCVSGIVQWMSSTPIPAPPAIAANELFDQSVESESEFDSESESESEVEIELEKPEELEQDEPEDTPEEETHIAQETEPVEQLVEQPVEQVVEQPVEQPVEQAVSVEQQKTIEEEPPIKKRRGRPALRPALSSTHD